MSTDKTVSSGNTTNKKPGKLKNISLWENAFKKDNNKNKNKPKTKHKRKKSATALMWENRLTKDKQNAQKDDVTKKSAPKKKVVKFNDVVTIKVASSSSNSSDAVAIKEDIKKIKSINSNNDIDEYAIWTQYIDKHLVKPLNANQLAVFSKTTTTPINYFKAKKVLQKYKDTVYIPKKKNTKPKPKASSKNDMFTDIITQFNTSSTDNITASSGSVTLDVDKQILKDNKLVHQNIQKWKGIINKDNYIHGIKKQLKGAYFTNDLNNDDDDDDDDKQNHTPVNTGKWDKDLGEGISTVISSQQNQMFLDIIKKFENGINKKLDEHKELQNKININSDIQTIKQELNSLMNRKKGKIDNDYKEDLKDINDKYSKLNDLWEQKQLKTLQNGNNDNIISEKINSERIKRKQYQQRQIENINRKYRFKQQNIDKSYNDQEMKLLSTNNVKEWHNKFEEEEIKKEKINTLSEMVKNKIEITNSQITFAKYLHNSPFADNLKENAKKFDHEITKIASLAGEPLLIDMVNREAIIITDNDKDNDCNEYLEFELRMDEEYTEWNGMKQLDIRKELASLIGINGTDLEFISSREGCIIAKFKAKMKSVYKKVKEIKTEFVDAVSGGVNYGYKEFKKEIKQTVKDVLEESWADKVDSCVPFLQSRIGSIKTNKDALYLATKCVAVIISQHNKDKNKSVIDGDFLKDDVQKESYKVVMDPAWDKEYGPGKVHWDGAINDGIDRGGEPYYCPSGWKRYGIRVDNFDEKTKGWSVCYHGTQATVMGSILSHGIFGTQDLDQRFFSPSIEYSAHPRYATPKKTKNSKFVQMVFQCRINSDGTIMRKQGDTTSSYGASKQIDPNFAIDKQTTEIEWFLDGHNLDQYLVYGIMMRISDDPAQLPSSHWWKDTAANEYGGSGYKIKWRED